MKIRAMTHIKKISLLAALLLTACGGGDTKVSSTITASVTASQLAASLGQTASGRQLLQLTGAPTCGVDAHYLSYGTKGGAGESTNATGALMIPTGTGPGCTGARPVVLYSHGTSTDKGYNLAFLGQTANPASSESGLIAALYAAHGFIVVAPNYAGYDKSTLPYHPFLNAAQQGQEMIDALTAARSLLPGTNAGKSTTDSGQLFVTGYSEGGHVAMAATRALEQAGQTVTASAPLSGPYAMALFGDAIFGGSVNLGGPEFAPLLATSYQKAYGNIYTTPSDLYTPQYVNGMELLLPSFTDLDTLVATGKLPQTALFQTTPPAPYAALDPISPASPAFAYGFDPTSYLINTSYRAAYLADANANPDGATATPTTNPMPAAAPAHPLRIALKTNDLRGYAPTTSILLCGGNNDPVVFFINTNLVNGIWAPQTATLKYAVLDIDTTAGPSLTAGTTAGELNLSTALGATQKAYLQGAAAQLQPAFQSAKQAIAQNAVSQGATDGGATAVLTNYHTTVAPFCGVAARTFFTTFVPPTGP